MSIIIRKILKHFDKYVFVRQIQWSQLDDWLWKYIKVRNRSRETFLLFHHSMQQEFDYFVIHMVTHKHMVYPKTDNYDKKTKISTDLLTCRVLAERCNLPI